MDFDFSHIAPVKTAEMSLGNNVRFPADNPEPIKLEVRYAGDGNDGYLNARLKMPPGKDRAERLAQMAKLYSRHVITGWKNVDKPFTPVECEKLLMALVRAHRTDVLDYIVAFCTTEENFHDPVQSAADLGKE